MLPWNHLKEFVESLKSVYFSHSWFKTHGIVLSFISTFFCCDVLAPLMEDDPFLFKSSKLLLLLLLLKLLDVEWWSEVESGWCDCGGKWWLLATILAAFALFKEVDIKLAAPGCCRKFWFGDFGETLVVARPGVVCVWAATVKCTGWL